MTPFLKQVAEDLVAKFGNDLQHCAIVFNNKRPIVYLRKYLADIIKKPFFSPTVYTIQEFFTGSVKEQPADFYLQFFTLLNAYNGLLEKEKLPKLKSSQFFPLAKIILNDFSQIDNDLVDVDKLYQEMEDIAQINIKFDYLSKEQYEFIARFWKSYNEGKHKKQQELFIKMWRRMPLLYDQFHKQLKAKNYITNGQIYRFLANADLVSLPFIQRFNKGKIIFVGFNALTKAESAVFIQLQNAEKALFYFDTDSYYINDELQEAGFFLRKNLNALGLKNVFKEQQSFIQSEIHQVNAYKVQGQTAQAKILRQILDSENPADEQTGATAIILADESLLLPVLQTIPDHKELNVTMGYPLASSAILGLVNLWLTTQSELREQKQVSCQTLEAFLTHPLTGLSQKMKDKIHLALLAEKGVNIEQSRLQKQGGIFEKFYQSVTEPIELVKSLLEMMKYLLARLSSANMLKKIDAELFVKTIEELTRLNDTLKQFVPEQEFAFLIQLVQKALQSVTAPLSGSPLTGIQLMGLLETRSLNFDNIVFLGFNEGVISKTSIGNSFIPDSIRRAFNLPVLENLDAISSYMVYRLLQRAKTISFIYNNLTDENSNGEASRILKQLEYESSFQFRYQALNSPVSIEKQSEIVIDKNDSQIKEVLQRYLRKEKTLSPSAITTYIANPIDFFFRYIADIKEPEELSPVIETNQIGSILHKTMEYFYQDFKGKSITKEKIQEKQKKVPNLIKQAFAWIMFNNPQHVFEYSGIQKVISAIVEAYINIILDQDKKDAPFWIMALEEKFNADFDFMVNGKKESITLFGIIDRIDEKNGVTRIIDYKTGSDKLSFSDIEKIFDTDDKYINKALIQTLIYANVYEKKSDKTQIVPCLYAVRTMVNEDVYFRSGQRLLNDAFLEEIKPVFLGLLQEKISEIFDLNVPFKASTVPNNYMYSIYTTLFGA